MFFDRIDKIYKIERNPVNPVNPVYSYFPSAPPRLCARLFLICFSSIILFLTITNTSYEKYVIRDSIIINLLFCTLIIILVKVYDKYVRRNKISLTL